MRSPFTLLDAALFVLCAAWVVGAQTPADSLLIVALGDSTTAPRRGVERVYPRRLESALSESGRPVRVLNAGISGNTTEDARRRLTRDVLYHVPDLVIVQFGLNDAAMRINEGMEGPRVACESYRWNLEHIVDALRADGAQVILMTPNPMRWTARLREVFCGPPYDLRDPDGANRLVVRYAAAVREVAHKKGVTLVDIYGAFKQTATDNPELMAALLPDGLHPSDQGHELVAAALTGAIMRTPDLKAVRERWRGGGSPQVRELVSGGRGTSVHFRGRRWHTQDGALVSCGAGQDLYADVELLRGDFQVHAVLSLGDLGATGASFELGEASRVVFDGKGKTMHVSGKLFGGGTRPLTGFEGDLGSGRPFEFDVIRKSEVVELRIDEKLVGVARHRGGLERFGFVPGRGLVRLREFRVTGQLRPIPASPSRSYTIPVVDLEGKKEHRVVVDREEGKYLGHPTTVLLEDGKTMIAVYPTGHGSGAILMKRSTDGGLTWSPRLPTPQNWSTSKEVPTIHRVVDKRGRKRLILFSGLHPIRMAVSEDDGRTWSPLRPIGDFGGIVTMAALASLANGDYMAFFHDDGRFIRKGGRRGRPVVFKVYKTVSHDGGLTWGSPAVIAEHPRAHLCEPGFVRSPDGREIALLLRENSRRLNSFVIFSRDEGATWSDPRELPAALTGDRHTARYAPDGRLFITFRDTTLVSPTKGDWVGWVGTWEDIVKGREGQYRVRLADNHRAADCAYPGLELLPDGTFVTTTYGHWTPGQKPYIISMRFKLEELDRLVSAVK